MELLDALEDCRIAGREDRLWHKQPLQHVDRPADRVPHSIRLFTGRVKTGNKVLDTFSWYIYLRMGQQKIYWDERSVLSSHSWYS